MRRWSSILCVTGGLLLILAGSANAQKATEGEGRRDHFGPGLILETGARMGACDVLTFTQDGKHLLATGDDKVVRIWSVTEKGLTPERTLRWLIGRSLRGAIYAMALSPDRDQRYVAIAGFGAVTGAVVVLDRVSGEVVHALTDTKGNTQAIWTLAFSPSGKSLAFGTNNGGVWLWNLASGKKNDVRMLDKHGEGRVRLVAFTNEDELLSVGADSRIVRWDVARSRPTPLYQFEAKNLSAAALSPDHKWLVAAMTGTRTGSLALFSFDTKTSKILQLPPDDLARSVAFTPDSRKLAVGVQTIPEKATFYIDTKGAVYLFDLGKNGPKAEAGPKVNGTPEVLAFHRDGVRLAVAGGPNYEVSLWNTHQLEKGPLQEIVGPGRSLWSVGFSKDGHRIGYQDERDPNPKSPNQRGKGPWHVFKVLEPRGWALATDFEPVKPLESVGGWTVRPDQKDAFVWYAVPPDRQPQILPLDRDPDDMPRCYTFLPPVKGVPVRLAVGHYWGFSIFELRDGREPKRIYLGVGHQGYVSSIAPSADGKLLLTASPDQTIAAWSLTDWPSKSQFGAKFDVRLNRLLVDQVDPGSPAWEAGLQKGDEIVRLQFARNQFLYDPQRHFSPEERKNLKLPDPINAETCLARLNNPQPNREYYFRVQRATEKTQQNFLTTLRRRPLWYFFPTHDGEWVMWRHHDYYYDTSPGGAKLLGWQVSEGLDPTKAQESLGKKPAFHKADEFASVYRNPDKIDEAVKATLYAPDRAVLEGILPPNLSITVLKNVAGPETGVQVQLHARPQGERDSMQAERLVLWIGDHRYKEWPAKKGEFKETITIPGKDLRSGSNWLTLQCYDKGGGCTIAQVEAVKPGAVRPRLFVLLVGIEIYSAAKGPGGRPLENLPGLGRDVDELEELFTAEINKNQFAVGMPPKKLLDEEATPQNILTSLEQIREKAGPDDLVVIYLAGHGYTEPKKNEKGFKAETFAYAGPKFDIDRPAETGLPSQKLYTALTNISARKLVWLMSCHSGDASRTSLSDPVQELSFGGIGPTVFTACQHRESAYVDPNKGSLFAQAIRQGFEREGPLNVPELARFVQNRVPRLTAELGLGKNITQTPAFFPEISMMEPLLLKGK